MRILDKMKTQTTILILAVFILSLSLTSAVVISDVRQGNLFPGETVTVNVDVKNTLNEDIEDVSLTLILDDKPFITIGGNEDSEEEIGDGDEETFTFKLKAAQDITPGDYNIPYVLTFVDSDGNSTSKTGSIGIEVGARTELEFSALAEGPAVVGRQGKVSLEIRNIGFGDVKFTSVKIQPQGFIVLGEDNEYLGNIDSDDFETADFDVIFRDTNARLVATVTYKDFDNQEVTKVVNLPLTVYTKEKALELGLIQKNYNKYYLGGIIILLIVYLIYKRVKKVRKRNRRNE